MSQGAKGLARLPLAGSAIALLAALTHWFPNMNRVPYENALPTIAAMVAISLVLLALFRPIAGGWIRAGLMAGIAAAYLLYLPAPVAALSDAIPVQAALFVAAAVLAIVLARRIPRDEAEAAALNRKLNLLLVPVTIGFSVVAVVQQVRLEDVRPDPDSVFPPFEGRADAASPDVWHIIFDRYASRETLATVYDYDNRPVPGGAAGARLPDRRGQLFQLSAHRSFGRLDAERRLSGRSGRPDDGPTAGRSGFPSIAR